MTYENYIHILVWIKFIGAFIYILCVAASVLQRLGWVVATGILRPTEP